MKKTTIITMAMLLTAMSCQKNIPSEEDPANENQPIKLTLTASIARPETKVTYTDEINTLKFAWEEGDQVSLITLDENGKVLSNDVLTAKDSGTNAQFEGTWSNPENAKTVSVYYPALTEGDGSKNNEWESKNYDGYSGEGVLSGCKKGNSYIYVRSTFHFQTKNGDPSDLKHYVVMKGDISDIQELSSGKTSSALKNMCYVIKVKAKVPETEAFEKITSIKIEEETRNHPITFIGGTSLGNNFCSDNGNPSYSVSVGLGDKLQDYYESGSGVSSDSEGCVTAYMMCYGGKEYTLPSGTELKVSIYSLESAANATITLARDNTFEPGKMYRLNATLK